MSNIDLVNAFITAVHLDRFAEIEARHSPVATFHPFLGPDLHDSVAIADWHRNFLRDYADCTYTEIEYLEQGDTVAIRATLEAKGYDWRRFTQDILEVFRFEDELIAERRQYAMLRDIELDKQQTRALEKAKEDDTAKSRRTRKAVEGFYEAVLGGDREAAAEHLDENVLLVDSVHGIVMQPEAALDVLLGTPKPAFGAWRVTNSVSSEQNAAVELSIDPVRPRAADWVRMLGEKIAVIERHWMLREIGLLSALERERHVRRVIHPV